MPEESAPRTKYLSPASLEVAATVSGVGNVIVHATSTLGASISGAGVIELLFEMNREFGTTLVLVTHDEGLAARCARIVRLATFLTITAQ